MAEEDDYLIPKKEVVRNPAATSTGLAGSIVFVWFYNVFLAPHAGGGEMPTEIGVALGVVAVDVCRYFFPEKQSNKA